MNHPTCADCRGQREHNKGRATVWLQEPNSEHHGTDSQPCYDGQPISCRYERGKKQGGGGQSQPAKPYAELDQLTSGEREIGKLAVRHVLEITILSAIGACDP
jgi:hypothetical protein